MIWEINKIFQIIDKKKWNKLNIKQKKQLIIQIKIWTAINYIIHLHLSKLPIHKQLRLLILYYRSEPHAFVPLEEKDIVELFFRIKPIIPVLLYINYISLRTKKRIKATSQKKSRSKRTSKTSRSVKKSKSRKSKTMKGGYLFMLTSRGEKPIRGVDMENFLLKMDDAVQSVGYLPSAQPPEEGPSNPYGGFALLYFLARNNMGNASFYMTPYISDYTNIFKGGTYKYSTLLQLWKDYEQEIHRTEKKKTMDDEFMDNYEEFVKNYIGREEFRTKKDEYKKYLNNMQKYKEKNEIEKKLMEHYNKAKPDPPDKYEQMQGYMSTLDMITMATGMMGVTG